MFANFFVHCDNALKGELGKWNWDCKASTMERLRFYGRNYILNHHSYHDTNRKHFQCIICNKGFLLILPSFLFQNIRLLEAPLESRGVH